MICNECGQFSSAQVCYLCLTVAGKTAELRAELKLAVEMRDRAWKVIADYEDDFEHMRPVVEEARLVLSLDGEGRSAKESLDRLALALAALDRQEKKYSDE